MENQEIMDQFLENRQNYMMDNNSMQHMNVNVASAGCDALVGGIQAEVVSGGVAGEILGVKYDEHHEEHDVGDDDEWKYVKEVQQSEKQQQQQLQSLKNIGLDDDGAYESNELAEKETTNNAAHDFGNGDGGFVFGGDHHQHQQQQQQKHHDLFNMGNGHDTNGHDIVNVNEDFGNLVSTGFEEKLNMMDSEMDGLKNEGDFSSTSNVTESVEGFVPQVDLKIEAKSEQQEMVDEEEPSSLATNTTNGTSSLSENVPPQAVVAPQTNADFMTNLEGKENTDPLTPQRPNELDLEQAHSQLNPDAKEFIPSFGSNPASPTSPFATGMHHNEPELSDAVETQMYFSQAPSAVPRHLFGNDDFVAQSPSKGKGDKNMEAVSLPQLAEFEKEADKRPHELESEDVDGFQQRDEVMTPDQAIQQLPLDDLETQDKENLAPTDSTDFQPSSFMDHGPETCVDLDADFNGQPSAVITSLQPDDDVMKRSMYVASDEAIEDVLNSVQPIPTEIDEVNNSFIEESATESTANHLAGDKELLQVEEKEHVSHSPSTEEIQMNLQNTLNSSNKDIPQIPIDMDNANNMQESMYMEQEQHPLEPQQELEKEFHDEQHIEKEQLLEDNLPHDQDEEQLHHREEQQFQDEFKQEKQYEKQQFDENDLISEQKKEEVENFQDEVVQFEKQRTDEQQHHFKEEEEAQTLEELSEQEQQHDELYHDQPSQDLMTDKLLTEAAEENLLVDTTNPLTANVGFFESLGNQPQQEIHESFSSFKIADEISTVPAPEHQQQVNLNDVAMSPSPIADEKHLLEETKEQQLFSMSSLEQQMSEMMLNNTDGQISQAEEVEATTAIEDISENLISPDEAINQEQHHYQEEVEKTQEQDHHQHELEKIQEQDHHQEELQHEIQEQHQEELLHQAKEQHHAQKQLQETEEQHHGQEELQQTEEQYHHQEELQQFEEQHHNQKELQQTEEQHHHKEELQQSEEQHHHHEELQQIEEQRYHQEELQQTEKQQHHQEELQQSEEQHHHQEELQQTEEQHHHQEELQLPEEPSMIVDDSFSRHELECMQQHEHEQQQLEQLKEMEIEQDKQVELESAVVHESVESAIEQQYQQELESEMIAVEEPIIEAKQTAPLFTTEETEIVTKTEDNEEKPEEKQELPPCMIPETAPAELLEPPMKIQNETEIIKSETEAQEGIHEKPIEVEAVKETAVEELKDKEEDSAQPEVIETPEVKPGVPVEAAAVAAAAVVAATAAVAGKTAASPSKTKTETAKKPLGKTTATAAKPKVGSTPANKKPVEAAKKPVGLTAKPRTAPAKPAATSAEKKPIAKTTTTTTAARKPLSVTASKTVSKTTTTTTSTARTATAASKTTTTATRPTTAPRTVSSTTTTRKPVATSAATNGPSAKPRPGSAPAKPTTLGLSATNGAPKPKPTSPRAALTSQVRKTTPATTGAKSPVKSTATNGVTKTAATTLASKTKTTTSTVSSTAGKTFTARPAPKFSSSSSTTTTTTTARRSVGGAVTASTTTTITKTSSTPLRKSSPTKTATGRTPSKPTAGGLKSKAPATKPDSPPVKPAPIRKPVDKTIVANGEANAAKELNGTPDKITAPADGQQQQATPQNGDLQAVQEQNGDSSIPMQTEEQQQQQLHSLLETRDEQIPLDLINA